MFDRNVAPENVDIFEYHKECWNNRAFFEDFIGDFGCFSCNSIWVDEELEDLEFFEWVGINGETACCPKCGIDAIVPLPRYPHHRNKLLLERMGAYWFSEVPGMGQKDETVKIRYEYSDKFDLSEIQDCIYTNAKEKGFWDPERQNPYEKLALINSEVSEVLECLRDGMDPLEVVLVDGKPEGVGPEMADIIIRTLDLAGHWGLDMETLIMMKHRYNMHRPHLHGKKA